MHLWAERKWAFTGNAEEMKKIGVNTIAEYLFQDFQEHYQKRVEAVGEEPMSHLERFLMLNSIDKKWKEHLYTMDALRSGIGLRGYAQVDPKNEYKREGLEHFEELLFNIADEVTNHILRFEMASRDESRLGNAYQGQNASHPQFGGSVSLARPMAPRRQVAVGYNQPSRSGMVASSATGSATQEMEKASNLRQDSGQRTPDRHKPKVARNAPCPCGSGKKYKQCHGKN